jgi:hypothetical protein
VVTVTVAIIVESRVANLIVCESVELAQTLLPDALCVDGEGFVIGDTYEEGSDSEE